MGRMKDHGEEDTGEQDVRGLRRDLTGGSGVAPDTDPHVRDKEDVPHEGSLPDFYGLQDDEEDSAVTEALMEMVDSGEMSFAWDEDRQDFVFWNNLPDSEPDREEVTATAAPRPEIEPLPVKHTGRRRRPKPTGLGVFRNALVITVAAMAAPFAVANMPAETFKSLHEPDHNDDDSASSPSTEFTDAPVQVGQVGTVTGKFPRGASRPPANPALIASPTPYAAPSAQVEIPAPAPAPTTALPTDPSTDVVPPATPSDPPRHQHHQGNRDHAGRGRHFGRHRKPGPGKVGDDGTPTRPPRHRKVPEQIEQQRATAVVVDTLVRPLSVLSNGELSNVTVGSLDRSDSVAAAW